MARGGRGGNRGGGRGKGAGFAQSAGVANSYADTKKGAGSARNRGGGSQDSAIGGGRNARGQKVTIRTQAGDKHKTGQTGSVKRGAPSPISGNPKPTPSGGMSKLVAPTVNKNIYGRGGSK